MSKATARSRTTTHREVAGQTPTDVGECGGHFLPTEVSIAASHGQGGAEMLQGLFHLPLLPKQHAKVGVCGSELERVRPKNLAANL